MKRINLLLLLLSSAILLTAQSAPKDKGLAALTPETVSAPMEFLASDWMTGRETGTEGEFMASDYIASLFRTIGLKPAGTSSRMSSSYFQNINFIQTRPGEDQECSIVQKNGPGTIKTDLTYGTDYSVSPGSQSIEFEGQVVFIGYGIEDKSFGQNDFKGLDIRGKVVVRLAGYPGWLDPESKNFKRISSAEAGAMRQLELAKDLAINNRGAVGIIEIRSGSAGFNPSPANVPFRYNEPKYEGDVPFNTQARYRTQLQGARRSSGPIRIQLSERALNTLIDGTGIDFNAFELEAATKAVKPAGDLPGRYIHVKSSVESKIVRGRNVIGVLEGKNPNRCIVVGAHYDHVGQTNGFIYNGSDDNASGTAGIISIARAMIATGQKPAVSIVFCAWTAEEKGLLGSKYYVEKPFIKDIRCYMNYDMISRTAPDDTTGMKCDFNYSSGLPELREFTEKHIRDYSLRLDMTYQTSPRPSGGSDFSSFSEKGIPIFLIHGKFTPDYHQYTDHSDKAVLPYMTDIIRLGYLNIFELANKNLND